MRICAVGLFLFAICAGMASASAATIDPGTLEQRFDAAIDPKDLASWMKTMAAEPNHVGSAHDKANAQWQLAQFKSFGWDAHIETFDVLYPTPVAEKLELLGSTPFTATLTEAPVPGDESSTRTANELPAYVVYQGDGRCHRTFGLCQLRHARRL